MIQEDYITVETAILARKKGFRYPIENSPQSILKKWLREEHAIIVMLLVNSEVEVYGYEIIDFSSYISKHINAVQPYAGCPIKVLEDALKNALESIKTNNNE